MSSPRPPNGGSPGFPRRLVFGLLVLVSTGTAVGYSAWAMRRVSAAERAGAVESAVTDEAVASAARFDGSVPALMFQNLVEGEHFARVGLVRAEQPNEARTMMPLRCQRLHYAAHRGLCLVQQPGFLTDYEVYVFGPDFEILYRLPLTGIPSRARVSPDGRYGATTVFVTGHSYADDAFSTATTLIDLATATGLGNLEEFTVWREGQRFKAIDFNFWGVTFARDANRFYATLGTGGRTYLVEGDVAAREMRVLRDNVECPSLAPDGTRIAFKKRVGGTLGSPTWRFHVLDLATMTETPLAETRSIDDQIEWLDDAHVLYAVAPDLWLAAADGSGEPRKFLSKALSPAVVRSALAAHRSDARLLALSSTDLAVAMSASSERVRAGQTLKYALTVTNHGPVDATAVGLDVRLPADAVFGGLGERTPRETRFGCSVQGGYVSCVVDVLPAGASWTVEFTVTPTAAGALRMRATVDAAQGDPAPANDSTSVVASVSAGT